MPRYSSKRPLKPSKATQKKVISDAREVLEDLTGDDEKKGREAAEAYRLSLEASSAERKAQELTELSEERGKIDDYKDTLAKMVRERLEQCMISPQYSWATAKTKFGVAAAIIAPNGKKYTSGFLPTHEPLMDLQAVERLADKVENTILELEGERLKVGE